MSFWKVPVKPTSNYTEYDTRFYFNAKNNNEAWEKNFFFIVGNSSPNWECSVILGAIGRANTLVPIICIVILGPFLQSTYPPCYLDWGSSRLCLSSRRWGEPSSTSLYSLRVYDLMPWFFTSLSDFWKVYKSPPSLHSPYFPTPDTTSRVVHVFILSSGALVLVLRCGALKIPCKIDCTVVQSGGILQKVHKIYLCM